MAVVQRVRRLANPFKKRRRTNPKPGAKRKLSLKQKLHFGTTRQRAAAKLALSKTRKRKRNGSQFAKRTLKAKRRTPVSRPTRRKRTARRNPALVVTLGALNPQKRRKSTVARRKRKSNPTRRRRVTVSAAPRRRRRRRSNPVVYRRRRRANSAPRRRRVSYRRRNPSVMGRSAFSVDAAKLVAGGLIGVTITKLVAGLIPASITSPLGNFAPVVKTGIAAIIAGMAAQKFMPGSIGDGVMFGGLMQTGSAILNSVAPGLKFGEYPLALSGMGDLVPGQFTVPQNPLRQIIAPAPPPQTNARVNISGLTRAFGTAF